MQEDQKTPMHPDEKQVGVDGTPKFGRLLIVLVIAVLMMAILTFASVEYYS